MTEKLFTGTLNKNQNKKQKSLVYFFNFQTALNICCNCYEILTKMSKNIVTVRKDVDQTVKSEDPDRTLL